MEKEIVRYSELPNMDEKWLSLCASLDDLDYIKDTLYDLEGINKEKFEFALDEPDNRIYMKFHEKLCETVANLESAISFMKSLAFSLMNFSGEYPFRY